MMSKKALITYATGLENPNQAEIAALAKAIEEYPADVGTQICEGFMGPECKHEDWHMVVFDLMSDEYTLAMTAKMYDIPIEQMRARLDQLGGQIAENGSDN